MSLLPHQKKLIDALSESREVYDANGFKVDYIIESNANTGLVLRLLPISMARVYGALPATTGTTQSA